MTRPSPDAEYAAFLAEGKFMLQRVRNGGSHVFYPRLAAPGTAEALEWVEASGLGRVYSTTTINRKPPAEPYNVALIDLDEGVRMMSRVEGVAPDDVRIGMRVKARIATTENGPLVLFDPV